MDRRTFLALTTSAAAGTVFVGCSGTYELLPGMPERGWDPHLESSKKTICGMCPASCGLRARLVDGKLVGLTGDPNHPTNAGGICRLGLSALQYQNHPDRILAPIKGRSKPQPATWEEAETAALAALTGSRGKALAFVGSHDSGRLQAWRRLMGASGGAVVLDSVGDGTEKVLEMVTGARQSPVADPMNSDFILTMGQDFFLSGESPLYLQRAYAELKRRGGTWVHIGPYLNTTASCAHHWLPCRPGTEWSVLLALAYVVLKEGAEAASFLSEHCTGLDQITPIILTHFSPKRAGIQSGTSESAILRVGQMLSRAKHPLILCGQEATWSENGHLSAWATLFLNALRGQFASEGGLISRGALPLNPLEAGLEAEAKSLWSFARGIFDKELSPPDVLFLDESDPVFSLGGDRRIREWIGKVPTVISFAVLPGETTPLSDWVLPSATFLEQWSDREQPPGVPFDAWLVSSPVLPPRGQSRPVGDILLHWLEKSGHPVAAKTMEELLARKAEGLAKTPRGSAITELEEMKQLAHLENRGWWFGREASLTLSQLAEGGGWADLNHASPNLSNMVVHKDGKFRLFPSQIAVALAKQVDAPGPEGGESTPVLFPFFAGPLNQATLFALPWTRIHAGLLELTEWEPWIAVHPETAARLNIPNRERVDLALDGTFVRIMAVHFKGLVPGVLAFPLGFGHASGGRWATEEADMNQLLAPHRIHPILDVPTPVGREINWRVRGA